MSEIRFKSDELLEEKLEFLKKKLKLAEKKEVLIYLVNKQFEKEVEGNKK
jgi:hypothetical protein